MNPARESGRHWESVAEKFLLNRGMHTLTRNFNCRVGEIDLIMRDGAAVVFVEVRFRKYANYGSGADTVGWKKQRRLAAAAGRFLAFNQKLGNAPCRFDVVSIGRETGELRFDWIQNAFDITA